MPSDTDLPPRDLDPSSERIGATGCDPASPPPSADGDPTASWIQVTRDDAAHALDEFAAEGADAAHEFREFVTDEAPGVAPLRSPSPVAHDEGLAATLELPLVPAAANTAPVETARRGLDRHIVPLAAAALAAVALLVGVITIVERVREGQTATGSVIAPPADDTTSVPAARLDPGVPGPESPPETLLPGAMVLPPADRLSTFPSGLQPRLQPRPATRALPASPVPATAAVSRDVAVSASRLPLRAATSATDRHVVTPPASPPPREAVATVIPAPSSIPMTDMRPGGAEASRPPTGSVAPAATTLSARDSVAASPPPPASSTASDSAAIASVLEQYRTAANSLDADGVAAVWPTTNARGLTRAFNQLISQQLWFSACITDVNGSLATSTCQGRTAYVPRVGSKNRRVEAREWLFALRKDDDRWVIDRLTMR